MKIVFSHVRLNHDIFYFLIKFILNLKSDTCIQKFKLIFKGMWLTFEIVLLINLLIIYTYIVNFYYFIFKKQ